MLPGMVLGKVTLGAALLVAATAAPASAAHRPVVVSGISEWASLAHSVAGPDATVISLLSDPNADPHDHEATTSDAANVARATVVVENGAGYDTWLSQLVAARSRPPTVVDAARLAGVSAGGNPHLFFSVPVAERVVRSLTRALVAHGAPAVVRTRATALLTRLGVLDRSIRSIARSCRGVRVAATEDVAGYLLDEAGLNVVTPERLRLAIGNGVDPSVHDLALALIQLERHPAFLVDNVQTATPLTNELVAQARSYHVPVIRVTETMTGPSYAAWIGHVVATVSAALRRQGCLA
jgi:zinc/manganese transport system substrate-binding protein